MRHTHVHIRNNKQYIYIQVNNEYIVYNIVLVHTIYAITYPATGSLGLGIPSILVDSTMLTLTGFNTLLVLLLPVPVPVPVPVYGPEPENPERVSAGPEEENPV